MGFETSENIPLILIIAILIIATVGDSPQLVLRIADRTRSQFNRITSSLLS